MKNKFKFSAFAAALLIVVFNFSACKDDDPSGITPEPTPTHNDMIKLGEGYILGAQTKFMAYAKDSLHTGYNTIYFALTDSSDGSELTEGHFTVNPMMDMGMMKHSAPVENNDLGTSDDGYFKASVVFIMPGSASQWALNLTFHNHKNNTEGQGSLGVNVTESTPSRIFNTMVGTDTQQAIFVSLLSPKTPVVGLNDIEFTVHTRNGMMDFPAVEDFTMEIEPEMPSMGHGSPNNVNPTHTEIGHYNGKVNFTMTGLWRIHVKLYKNRVLLDDSHYFDITL